MKTTSLVLLVASAALWACEPPPVVEPPKPDGETLFDDNILHEVSIEVAPELVQELSLDNDERIPASITVDGAVVSTIGIRLKGNIGSAQDINTGKPGFSIKTDEFVLDQQLDGISKFTLDNMVQDPSFVSAFLGHELFRRAGVPTARTAYARVNFNGEYFGVYLLVESMNKDFLKDHFDDASGNLFEGPGDLLNVDILDLDTNEEVNDRSDLEALREVVLGVDDSSVLPAFGRLIDLGAFLRYYAMESLVYHWDGYATFGTFGCCGPNNYAVYHEPESNRFFWLPRGMDGLFLDVTAGVLRPPSPGASIPQRLMANAAFKAEFAKMVRELLNTAWNVDELLAEQERALLLIDASVREGDRSDRFVLENYEAARGVVEDFLTNRPSVVLQELTESGL
jgi:spore coat protein H